MFHPRPWKNEVEAASKLTGTSEITIFALMKRESKFHSKAISQSGAVGLMQLMPATAEDEAQKLKMSADIYEPEDNILLGANHFSMLEHKFLTYYVLFSGVMFLKYQQRCPLQSLHYLHHNHVITTELVGDNGYRMQGHFHRLSPCTMDYFDLQR